MMKSSVGVIAVTIAVGLSALVAHADEFHPDCPWDIDGCGVVDIFDLVAVIEAWGDCPGCPQDVNGDDVVNVLDFVEIISNWGACP